MLADMARIALITQLPSLIEACGALADGIGAALDVHAPESGGWQSAALVLLGEDLAEPPSSVTAPTVLVSADPGPEAAAGIWQRAARLGADTVAVLPDAAEWLVQRLIAAVEPPQTPGLVVGVMGACGGAGASVLAAAVAQSAAQSARTVLIDGDRTGGGIDVLCGLEAADGLRWPDLAASRGLLRPSALTESLPADGLLSVLSWDRTTAPDPGADVVDSVLTAAGQAFDLVVIDLPRTADPALVRACAKLALVAPARVRPALAAARAAAAVGGLSAEVGLVVRDVGAGGLDPQLVADSASLELLGVMRRDRRLDERIDRGDGVLAGRTPLTGLADDVLGRWAA